MSILSSAPANYGQRKIVDYIMRGLTIVATLIAIVPLVLIIGYVTVIGGGAMSIDFFTKTYEPPAMSDGGFSLPSNAVTLPTPDPAVPVDPNATPDPFAGIDLGGATGVTPVDGTQKGEALSAKAQGGVLHAIIGTLLITGAALLFSLPIGILAAVFLAEYPSNTIATVVRFCTDLLSGAPSIIVGVTAYILIVVPFREFSGVAGAIALTFLMVPTITRTTEEVLKLVPESTREAALAMGAPTWYSTFTVVIPAAISGIVTGVMLAFARGAGETAPLILTVLGSNVISFNLLQPIAALPLITYRYTESPFPGENTQAWGSAFILMMLVLVVNIAVRLATRNRLSGR
ncbi:MAG: phosphate ABC transporter permease PstA [Roseiflexaceae bacterium]|nr:phosphate ABC transporter permease PstA [Roseiflexaceae bacterium]